MLPTLLRVLLCCWPAAQPGHRSSPSLDVDAHRQIRVDAQSGEELRQSQERYHHSLHESRSVQSSTDSLESFSDSWLPETRRKQVCTYRQQRSRKVSVEESPQLECIIVPSFGIDPPENVAVKKTAGDFLQGVGDDLINIQRLMREDENKELVNVQLMCHFERVKVATFLQIIKEIMQRLRLNGNNKKGCKLNQYKIH